MTGSTSILDRIGNTPMVRLDRISAGLRVPIYGKCEYLNPGGSIKDRIALAIVDDAENRGLIRPGMTLVEATAGNTGMGLAMVASIRGYKLACVMPRKMSVDKQNSLAILGAEVILVPNAPPTSPENFQHVARRLAAERGWFLADQFVNPANPRIHEQTTGPEIFEQLAGRVGAFVCGIGTGGTITGVGRYLRDRCPNVRIVLADPVGSRLAHLVDSSHPDTDSSYRIEGIGGSSVPAACDLQVVHQAERVTDEESFSMARRLMREEGLMVGGSSGTAVVAAVRMAMSGCDGPIVAILADRSDRYASCPWMQPEGANAPS